MAPLTHQEIRAAIENLQINPTPDEVRLMMTISREYVAQYNRSSKPSEPDPTYKPGEVDQEQFSDELDKWFDSTFGD